MNRQVITIGPDGTISGLQRKPGQGIDLRSFGHAEIERASVVEWNADHQAWYINILQGPGKGILTTLKFGTAFETLNAALQIVECYNIFYDDGVMYFHEYDDAVKVEIAYLDALRLKGQF